MQAGVLEVGRPDSIPDSFAMSWRLKAALVCVWLLIALPMTRLGYGADGDAWNVAKAAHEIWTSHHYVRSRTTGFPMHELLAAPLIAVGGWHLSNLIALLGGLALLWACFRLCDLGVVHSPIAVTLSIAFAPIVVTSASSTIDYVPALALLLMAYVAALRGRWLPCALFIGLACGFRPTSGLYVIPVLYYGYRQRVAFSRLGLVLATATAVGALAYSPALVTYGLPEAPTGPSTGAALRIARTGYNCLRFLGIVPTGAVIVAMLIAWRRGGRSGFVADPSAGFHGIVLGIWGVLFLALPDEPAYLLPALPSIVLLFDGLAPKNMSTLVAGVLLSHHLVQLDFLGGESGRRRLKPAIRAGHTLEDVLDRSFKLSVREAADELVVDRPTVLMFGKPFIPAANERWVLDPRTRMYRQKTGLLHVAGQIRNADQLARLKADGYRLVLWNGAKGDYFAAGRQHLLSEVEIVESLEDFFGRSLSGRASMVR